MSTTNNTLLFLSEKFTPKNAISRKEFREFLGISASTDWRAFKSGQYPRVIKIAGQDKILLFDLAAFLDKDQQPQQQTNPAIHTEKKRGRPRRSASPSELLATLGA